MAFLAVDLGTTNIKVAAYGDDLARKALQSCPVRYIRADGFVEFDPVAYCDAIIRTVGALVEEAGIAPGEARRIVLTGQAESLVVLDRDGNPLMNAISWMDERSTEECRQLAARFPEAEIRARTGQMAVLPTWPATKILWLKTHRPEVFERAAHYALLKDYLGFVLTGRLCADRSIATFSFYFDIRGGGYWPEMLEACGIREAQLPPLVEPCTNAGPLLPGIAARMGLSTTTSINVGTLDHFAGMVGTGNVQEGLVSLATGTTLTLAAMAAGPTGCDSRIALHYGFLPGTPVHLSAIESGGLCLEWFRDRFMKGCTFRELDERIAARSPSGDLLFLPFLGGTSAPDFDADARAMFYGFRVQHDELDFAYAVMEGVALLLARNTDSLCRAGIPVERILATGGGARSDVWCRIQADMTGVPVEIPEDPEAACLGAAMIGAVEAGIFGSYEAAARRAVRIVKRFLPAHPEIARKKRRQFDLLYDAMLETGRIGD